MRPRRTGSSQRVNRRNILVMVKWKTHNNDISGLLAHHVGPLKVADLRDESVHSRGDLGHRSVEVAPYR